MQMRIQKPVINIYGEVFPKIVNRFYTLSIFTEGSTLDI